MRRRRDTKVTYYRYDQHGERIELEAPVPIAPDIQLQLGLVDHRQQVAGRPVQRLGV